MQFLNTVIIVILNFSLFNSYQYKVENMSFEERNQFMPQNQNNDPMFNQFLQSCFNNPSFFQSMKSFYNTQINQTPTNRNQSSNISYNQLNSSITQSQPNLNHQYVLQNMKMQESRSQYNEGVKVTGPNIYDNFKKDLKNVGNPLLKYQEKQQNAYIEQASLQNQKKNRINKDIHFQDKPISSTCIQSMATKNEKSKNTFNLQQIKENKSINVQGKYQKWEERSVTVIKQNNPIKIAQQIDQMPIKSMKPEDYEQFYKNVNTKPPVKNVKKNIANMPAQEEKIKSNLYKQAQERPITGVAKDFKELMKEKLKSEKYVQIEDNQQQNQNISQNNVLRTQPKAFLKRGSRQHLSSAIAKGKPTKPLNNNDQQSKNHLDRSRSVTPINNKSQVRSVSQNRVLGKRPGKDKQNDKKLTKQITKNTQEQGQYSRVKLQKKQKPKQIQTKTTKAMTEKQSPLNNKKKKTKNVFDDSGQSSSSSDEQQFFTQKTHKAESQSTQNRIQVIPNVYLTNDQLQEILLKYGKKPKVQETESQKIKSLRNKYSELCKLAQLQKEQNLQKFQRERQQFEKYKGEQLNKLKNQRRVMQRQLKGNPSSTQNLQKQKEELQAMRQQIQKEREQYKRKDKNNKIILQKYKKQNQELKAKLQKMPDFGQKQVFVSRDKETNNKKPVNNVKIEQLGNDDKIDKTLSKYSMNSNNNKNKKEEEIMKEETSYKDIAFKDNKKDKILGKQSKEKPKAKYQYVQQQQNANKNKSTSFKPQVNQNKSIQNKWNNKFGVHSSSDQSQNSQEEATSSKNNLLQWSPAMKLSDLTKIQLSIKMVNEQMINSMFKFENIMEYKKYLQIINMPTRTIVSTSKNSKNGYVANLYSDRSKQLIYDNGTKKYSFQNGYSIVYFKNGDIKQILADKTVLYYFKDKQVDQITLSNGVNIYRFENNQVQFHYDNGSIEIRHPEGTIKVLGDKCTRR